MHILEWGRALVLLEMCRKYELYMYGINVKQGSFSNQEY